MNRHLSITLLSCSTLLVTACGISQAPDTASTPGVPTPPATPPAVSTPKVSFIAFGDAGRASATQQAVADAMTKFCQLKTCDFAIETGDNFYDAGVASTADAQWQTKFEVPYKGLNIPFYPTLGNHDNSSGAAAQLGAGEGSSNTRGNFQVDYTTLAGTSGRWKLPARYHSFTAPLTAVAGANPLIEFFCLDSSPLAATVANPAEVGFNYLTYGPTQMQWFQQGLTNTKAKWTISYAHHPYVSNGSHGNAGSFDSPAGVPASPIALGTTTGKPWKDLVDQSACTMGLDLYLNGHDHDIEWLKPVPTCNAKTEFILTGAGSDVRTFGDATRNPTYFQVENKRGFFWFEVTGTTLKGETYVLEGENSDILPLDAAGQPKPAFTRIITK